MSNILGGEARTDVMRDNIVRDSLLRVLKEKIQQCRNLQVLELVIDNKQVEQLTRGMLPERIYELRRSGIPWTTISSSLENKCGAHENLVYRRWVALIQYNTNIQSRMKDLYDYGLPDGEITACLFTEVPPHVIERIKIDLEAKTSIDANPITTTHEFDQCVERVIKTRKDLELLVAHYTGDNESVNPLGEEAGEPERKKAQSFCIEYMRGKCGLDQDQCPFRHGLRSGADSIGLGAPGL